MWGKTEHKSPLIVANSEPRLPIANGDLMIDVARDGRRRAAIRVEDLFGRMSMDNHRIGPETNRLYHRAFTIEDVEVAFALNSNPEVMRHTGEPMLQSLDEAKRFIENYPDFDTVGYGRWACILKETQKIIGFCGLKYLPDLDEVDVGYRLLPQYWGRGLATEACIASLNFGFATLQLEQIIGLVLPSNTASIRVLEKAGMHADGRFDYDGFDVLRYAVNRHTPE